MKRMSYIFIAILIVLFSGIYSYSQNNIDILRFDISKFPDISMICLPYAEGAMGDSYLDRSNYNITEIGSLIPDSIDIIPAPERIPYNFIIMVDNSRSVRKYQEIIHASIHKIADSVHPSDRLSLFLFDESLRKITDLSTDRELLLQEAGNLVFEGRYSNIYNSLNEIIPYLASNKEEMVIILFFTEGIDRDSSVSQENIIIKLKNENIKFINIGLGQLRSLTQLDRISAVTGFEGIRLNDPQDITLIGDYLEKRMENQIAVNFRSMIRSVPDKEYSISLRFGSEAEGAVSSFRTENLQPIKDRMTSHIKPSETELHEEVQRTQLIINYNDILRFDISKFPKISMVCLPYSKEADSGVYLDKGSYEITELGALKPSEINISRLAKRLPYNYILLVDNSDNMKNYREVMQNAIRAFVDSVDPGDRISLFIFDENAHKVTDLITDRDTVLKEAGKLLFYSRFSNIYDSLYQVSEYLLSNKADMNIIVLLTDGIDSDSMVNRDRVIEKLSRENIKFMNIGFGQHHGLTQLERISNIRGFESFRMNTQKDFKALMDFLPDRMDNQIEISFTSSVDTIPDREYFLSLRFSANGATSLSSFSTINLLPIQNYIASIAKPKEEDIPREPAKLQFISNHSEILRFDISQFPMVRMVCLPYGRDADQELYLDSSNYEITENGYHRPDGVNISRVANRLTYNYILVVDNSDNAGKYRSAIQTAIKSFIEAIDPADKLALFAFDENARKISDLSSDRRVILQEAGKLSHDGRYANIYDSLFQVCEYLSANRADMNIIVLFGTGIDTDSMVHPDRVIDKMSKEQIKFMNLGFGNHRGLMQLERISNITGFDSFRLNAAEDFRRLAEFLPKRMNNQVMVSYKSSLTAIPDRDYFVSLKFSYKGITAVSSFSTGNILPIQNYIISLSKEGDGKPSMETRSSFITRYNLILAAIILVFGMLAVALLRRQKGKAPYAYRDFVTQELSESHTEDYSDHTQVLEDIPDLTEEEMEEEEFDDEILSKTIVMSEEPVIIIKQGSSRKITYDLGGKDNFTIGRAEGNSIVLANRSVSSKHCIIRKIGGAFVIYDLKSTNGTFVNGQRIKKALLKPGDTIHIGETILDFQLRRK